MFFIWLIFLRDYLVLFTMKMTKRKEFLSYEVLFKWFSLEALWGTWMFPSRSCSSSISSSGERVNMPTMSQVSVHSVLLTSSFTWIGWLHIKTINNSPRAEAHGQVIRSLELFNNQLDQYLLSSHKKSSQG